MPKVPTAQPTTFIPAVLGAVMLGAATLGGGTVAADPLLVSLRSIFADADPDGDPVHIFQAIKSGCDYFLTLDETTILRPAFAHQKRLVDLGVTMAFVDPLQLVRDLAPTGS